MTRSIVTAVIAALGSFLLYTPDIRAQDNPVSWKASAESLGGDTVLVKFNASISGHWHLYDLGPYTDGPNPTAFALNANPKVTAVGQPFHITQPTRIQDKIFGMEIGYFSREATFGQKVTVKGNQPVSAVFNVEWMVCDDTNCIPPADENITVTLPGNTVDGVSAGVDTTSADTTADDDANISGNQVPGTNDLAAQTPSKGHSLWGVIIEAILWGFAALLTPCVFPMIPMTVSFFIKGSGNPRRGRFMAMLYGIAIIALYTVPIGIIILLTRIIGGESVTADIFNWLATHWIPNVIFFLVFMIFAASFFGAFEITMPSRLVNKSDQKADKGGLLGVFFMALTLVLVSFSCTGPIVGSVLIKSTSGEIWEPIVTMFAFSTAFALPFTVFALFPQFLSKLPKSGGWLNSVKIVLGFLELALGLKFLSVADQTYHWGILDREVYLALWIVIFSLLGLYLLGKLTFAHDSKRDHIGVSRLLLAIITLSFVVYMIPGMWGAPLKAISGYIPPMHTQDFVLGGYGSGSANNTQTNRNETNGPSGTESAASPFAKAKYSDFLSLPFGLQGFFDYDEALAYAKQVGKPVFLDYTGHGCVNCREMEARVWSDPEVLSLLRNDFVILALYSDDKKTLPESEWVTTPSGRTLKSLGKINADLAHQKYGINFQPYYLILTPEGKQIGPGRSYDLSIPGFVSFLKDGLNEYRNNAVE